MWLLKNVYSTELVRGLSTLSRPPVPLNHVCARVCVCARVTRQIDPPHFKMLLKYVKSLQGGVREVRALRRCVP
jgi:hypothetical protein